ncbi:response regulator [Sphingomonas sp. PL-96]|uniref:response regulator n=1 Tax=Sphingomonas sp. PL-96 TaxID=2887201 RepID=UPI001E28654F|nr:response regulator [Sphingomonas sp. PL-96]MCC2976735.1 response regulator [Sphingomonas sp. PL-96]
MADFTLHQCRILVVEDEYLLADELALELADEGAVVLGPVSNISRALALLDEEARPDGAILDINLGGEPAFPLADALINRGVPLVFTTGYDARAIPERFAGIPRCEKPISIGRITAALGKAMHS